MTVRISGYEETTTTCPLCGKVIQKDPMSIRTHMERYHSAASATWRMPTWHTEVGRMDPKMAPYAGARVGGYVCPCGASFRTSEGFRNHLQMFHTGRIQHMEAIWHPEVFSGRYQRAPVEELAAYLSAVNQHSGRLMPPTYEGLARYMLASEVTRSGRYMPMPLEQLAGGYAPGVYAGRYMRMPRELLAGVYAPEVYVGRYMPKPDTRLIAALAGMPVQSGRVNWPRWLATLGVSEGDSLNGQFDRRRLLAMSTPQGLYSGQYMPEEEVFTWWDDGGTISGCVGAWRAKGAASYADSKSNLANPGTYDLSEYTTYGSANPSWTAADGWYFNGSTSYMLKAATSLSVDLTIVVWARWTASSDTAVHFYGGSGSYDGYIDSALVSPNYRVRFYYTSTSKAIDVGTTGYLDGAVAFNSTGVWVNGSKTTISPTTDPLNAALYIGGLATGGERLAGYVRAVALYNRTLSDAEVGTILTNIAAL